MEADTEILSQPPTSPVTFPYILRYIARIEESGLETPPTRKLKILPISFRI